MSILITKYFYPDVGNIIREYLMPSKLDVLLNSWEVRIELLDYRRDLCNYDVWTDEHLIFSDYFFICNLAKKLKSFKETKLLLSDRVMNKYYYDHRYINSNKKGYYYDPYTYRGRDYNPFQYIKWRYCKLRNIYYNPDNEN